MWKKSWKRKRNLFLCYNQQIIMRTIILIFVIVVFVLVAIPFLLVCALFRLKTPIFIFTKAVLRLCIKIPGLRLEIHGKEWIQKKQNYVFMANHLSYLDAPLIMLAIPQNVRAILKKTILRLPVIGLAMKLVEFVPVDRTGTNTGKKSIEKAIRLMREKKYSFLIFPEGTRSPHGKLQALRRGGFFLAINSGVPIIPLTIQGTFNLMPKGGFWIRRGIIRIEFFAPVSVQEFTEESLPQLKEHIQEIIRLGLESK